MSSSTKPVAGAGAAASRDESHPVADVHRGDHGKETHADNEDVGRFASALAFLAVLVIVVGAAGCGQRFERSGNAPAPADLAADALAALEAAGSAHFVADLKTEASDESIPLDFSVHAEGDASRTALDAQAEVSFGGASFRGRLLVGEHDFFIQFMDRWYGEQQGLVEAMAEGRKEHDGRVWDELATAEGLRRNFDELFDGEVGEGPVVDGVPTWQFEGTLDADGVLDFARRFEATPTDLDERMLRIVADATRLVLVVGRDDALPRRLEVSVELSADDLKEMEGRASGPFAGAANFSATLELSDFGKSVEIQPPEEFKPLDALFEQLFSGFE